MKGKSLVDFDHMYDIYGQGFWCDVHWYVNLPLCTHTYAVHVQCATCLSLTFMELKLEATGMAKTELHLLW